MLLDHTSGLPGNCMLDLPKSPHMIADIVARLADMPFNSDPGELWSYSNAGMAVLGRIAEVLSGTTFDGALAARILRPLGLHATVAAMQTPQADMPWALGYDHMGLGWTIRQSGGHTMVSHTGANAGAHSSLALVPDQQGAIAVLTNGTTGAAVHGKLTAELLREFFGVEPAVPVKAPATPVQVNPERYTGVFIADDGEVTFTIEAGRLRVAPVAAPGLLQSFYLMGFPPPRHAFLTPVSDDGRFVSDQGHARCGSSTTAPAGRKYVYVGRIYRRATRDLG
jgi:hypothetical protein